MKGLLIRTIGVIIISLLAIFPLVFKILSTFTGVSILSSDLVQVNLVFMFASIAGLITSAEGKQLGLSFFSERLPQKVKIVLEPVLSATTIALLTALFLAAFSEYFMIFTSEESLWGIPLRSIFATFPLMYAGMLAIRIITRKRKVACILGAIIGILIASGPLAGIVYYLTGIESVPLANLIFENWIVIAQRASAPLIIFLVIATALGLPIFLSLSGIAYIAFSGGGGYVEMISLEAYSILTDKSIAAIPLFTLTGFLLAQGSAGKRLLEVVKNSVGWIPGGPVIAAVIVAIFFTTFTGASGVTILALGGLLSVILTGSGYKKENAESLITASGSIGMLFPPSLAIIIYGTTNIFSVDIFDLFKGAIIPGTLLAIATIIVGIRRDKLTERVSFNLKEFLISIKNSIPELLLPIGIITGYFTGVLSLIETAAASAVYTFILEVIIRKDFSLKESSIIIKKSLPIAGGILVIIGAAKGLAYFLVDAGIPFLLTDLVVSIVHSKYLFLFLLNILLLAVGCVMDLYSAILVVSPLIIPVAESYGIHPVHIGVIFLTNLSLGFLTPPVGMNLFIASYTFEKPVLSIVKNIMPYILIQFIILLLITYVPWFTTALIF